MPNQSVIQILTTIKHQSYIICRYNYHTNLISSLKVKIVYLMGH